MVRTVSIFSALAVGLLWVATAGAQTPFGGDDTGFIPPPKSATAKCESKASKAVVKLISCIAKCHDSTAAGKIVGDDAENMCEKTLALKSCTAKFAASIAKLTGCPPCISGATMASLAGLVETLLDGNNGMVYCSASPSGAFVE
jgi:hypothetical protein